MKTKRMVLTAMICIIAVTLQLGPASPAATANGSQGARNGQIAYAAYDPDLGDLGAWVANADGSSPRRLGLPSFSYRLAWSPDGLLVVQAWQGTVMRPVVVRSDGSGARVLNPPGLSQNADRAPCVWTPNGEQLVCQLIDFTGDHSKDGLWLLNPRDLQNPRRLTTNPYPPGDDFGGGDLPGSVSPDGKWVVFTRVRQDPKNTEGQAGALFKVSIDGRTLRRLTPYGSVNSHDDALTSWSPDGCRIVYGSADGRIYTIRPDGTHRTEIQLRDINGASYARSPSWSPDGTLILARIYSEAAGEWGLYRFTPQGTHLTKIDAPEDAEVPVWGPQSKGK